MPQAGLVEQLAQSAQLVIEELGTDRSYVEVAVFAGINQ